MSKDEVQDVKLLELERRLVKLEDDFKEIVKKLVLALIAVASAIVGSHQIMWLSTIALSFTIDDYNINGNGSEP